MRATWLMVAAVLALAGCTSRTEGEPAKDDSPVVGPVSLVVPIEMRPVLEQTVPSGSPAPSTTSALPLPSTTVLPDPSGEQLTLAEPIMVVEQLERAEIKREDVSTTWTLVLDLTEKDSAIFAGWTVDHVDERLAMVIDGEVVVAPTIQAAIIDGSVQISGDYTEAEIHDLLDKITGR